MTRMFLIAMLQVGAWQLWAQTNLVPNPSFEQNIGCPTSNYQIELAVPWVKVGGDGGLSYFNDCGSSNYRAQSNNVGFGGARSGIGMAWIILLANNHVLSFHAEGNFLGTSLLNSLIEDKKYRVRFYLSLTDYHRFASKNVGVHFSNGQPQGSTSYLLSLNPQIQYSGDFLTDKVGWMKIEGEFTAVGGENYLTIGNFDGYDNSDTLNLHEGGTMPSIGYWEAAYYYIDDVSVTEVDTTLEYEEAEEVREPNEAVGVGEQLAIGDTQISIWPNPAKDLLSINVSDFEEAVWRFELYTPLGQRIAERLLQLGQNQLDVTNLKSGIYYWRVFRNSEQVNTDKVIITK